MQHRAPMPVPHPPWLFLMLRLFSGREPLGTMEPWSACAAHHLWPGACHHPTLSHLLVPPGRPADRYVALRILTRMLQPGYC